MYGKKQAINELIALKDALKTCKTLSHNQEILKSLLRRGLGMTSSASCIIYGIGLIVSEEPASDHYGNPTYREGLRFLKESKIISGNTIHEVEDDYVTYWGL